MELHSYQKLAYLGILICNICLVVGATFILWRVHQNNVDSSRRFASSLHLNTKAVKRLETSTDGIREAARELLDASRKPSEIDNLSNQKMLAELHRISSAIDQIEVGKVLSMLDTLLQEWQATGSQLTSQEQRASGQVARLKSEVSNLQVRLAESSSVITNMRRENRATFTSSSALQTLKDVNEKLFAEIKSTRARMLKAEERVVQLDDQLHVFLARSAPLTAVPEGTAVAGEADDELLRELNELRTDRLRIMNQLQHAEDDMQRMLREKTMLEERYLELDSVISS